MAVRNSAISAPSELPLRRWTGRGLRRFEDERLLRGQGRFTDDLQLGGMLHAAFVRSKVAHGVLVAVDVTAALKVPGVLAVLTADALGTVMSEMVSSAPLGAAPPAQPCLCRDRVRFVGEPIAVVIADSRYAAEDGVELVEVSVDPLPAVTTMDQAADPKSEPIHPRWSDTNILAAVTGDPVEGLDEIFAAAPHQIAITVGCDRMTASPMEGRAIVADFRAGSGTVWVSSQAPHYLQTGLSRALGLPESSVRVISNDVGGGFGSKLSLYQEYVAVAAASLHLARPIKWTADRQEELLTSCQAREQDNSIRAAVDEDGRVLALQLSVRTDGGAYSIWPQTALLEPFDAVETYPGLYAVQLVSWDFTALMSNKPPTGPYRGISRVHATLGMERLMDEIAAELDLDPLKVRLRNVVTEFPYRTAGGLLLESGSYRESIYLLQREIDLAGFRIEQNRARSGHRYLGFGAAMAIEPATPGRGIGELAADVMNHYETASLRVEPDGGVTVLVGTHSHGQGHETTFAQITADLLGIEPGSVAIRFGDTGAMPYGSGTWASRSAVLGSGAITLAANRVVQRAKASIAAVTDTDLDAVSFESGRFCVRGGQDYTWSDLGRLFNHESHRLPCSVEPGLEATARYVGPDHGTVSNRLHAAIVEVDITTGLVDILRYIAIEDCGNMINPMVVAGQVFGGVAQGIGQTFHEALRFDDNGQPLTTSLRDYLLPRIDSVPHIELHHLVSPAVSAPYGLKGMGEGGVIPPPAVLTNAVTDALRPFGARFNRTPISADHIFDATHGRAMATE